MLAFLAMASPRLSLKIIRSPLSDTIASPGLIPALSAASPGFTALISGVTSGSTPIEPTSYLPRAPVCTLTVMT